MNAGMVGTLLSLLATLGVAWLLTYAVHSTVLIGSVWLAERAGLLRSLRLRDLAWRTALVGGLVTATLQLAAGLTPIGGATELQAPALADLTPAAPPATDEAPRIAIVARTVHAHPQPVVHGHPGGTPRPKPRGLRCRPSPRFRPFLPFLRFPPCPRFRPSRRPPPPAPHPSWRARSLLCPRPTPSRSPVCRPPGSRSSAGPWSPARSSSAWRCSGRGCSPPWASGPR